MSEIIFKRTTAPRISVDIVEDKVLVGEIWLIVINGVGQLGYCLPQHLRGCGIATECVKQLCSYAFGNTSIKKLISHAHPTNTASIRVLEKAGFVPDDPPEIASYGMTGFSHFVLLKDDWSKIEPSPAQTASYFDTPATSVSLAIEVTL